jgi:GcrA cell cycle regulator
MSSPPWTDDRIETLKTLWLSGLSASQIAKALGGVTRNAVIGKLHRLGVAGRCAPAPPRPAGRRAPGREPKMRAQPASGLPRVRLHQASPRNGAGAALEALSDVPGRIFDLAALGRHDCRWPIGDPGSADFSFCGRRVLDGRAYCADHHRRAHRGAEARLERDPFLRRLLAGTAA